MFAAISRAAPRGAWGCGGEESERRENEKGEFQGHFRKKIKRRQLGLVWSLRDMYDTLSNFINKHSIEHKASPDQISGNCVY
jgi:hypothetical protein